MIDAYKHNDLFNIASRRVFARITSHPVSTRGKPRGPYRSLWRISLIGAGLRMEATTLSQKKQAAIDETRVVGVDKDILIFVDGMILHPWGALARDIREALVEHRQEQKGTNKVCGSRVRACVKERGELCR